MEVEKERPAYVPRWKQLEDSRIQCRTNRWALLTMALLHRRHRNERFELAVQAYKNRCRADRSTVELALSYRRAAAEFLQ